MIFKNTWQKVLDGTKTQTRRIVKKGGWPYRVGKFYAVQPGRGKKSIGRILIKRLWIESLHDISFYEIIEEGFQNTADFIAAWDSIYGKTDYRWEKNPIVYVLRFELMNYISIKKEDHNE